MNTSLKSTKNFNITHCYLSIEELKILLLEIYNDLELEQSNHFTFYIAFNYLGERYFHSYDEFISFIKKNNVMNIDLSSISVNNFSKKYSLKISCYKKNWDVEIETYEEQKSIKVISFINTFLKQRKNYKLKNIDYSLKLITTIFYFLCSAIIGSIIADIISHIIFQTKNYSAVVYMLILLMFTFSVFMYGKITLSKIDKQTNIYTSWDILQFKKERLYELLRHPLFCTTFGVLLGYLLGHIGN
ncbi:hypothetical protein AB9G22_09185 [Francisella philomiragia]|uniref:hypothetical protein n=1 Tax=Francisella philomiragia TaxID=28110 RepID=UPI0035132C13